MLLAWVPPFRSPSFDESAVSLICDIYTVAVETYVEHLSDRAARSKIVWSLLGVASIGELILAHRGVIQEMIQLLLHARCVDADVSMKIDIGVYNLCLRKRLQASRYQAIDIL